MPELTYHEATLDDWGVRLTFVVAPEGIYVPIMDVCAILGVVDYRGQSAILRDRRVTAPYIKQWPIPTPTRGRQAKTCIHQKALGFWLGYINEKRVRPEIRDNLIELQQDILEAAYRCIFGEVPGVHASSNMFAMLPANITAFQKRIGPIKAAIVIPDQEDGE